MPDGVVVYVHDEKKLVTKEAPSVDGWTLRAGASWMDARAGGQELETTSFYEDVKYSDGRQ